MGQCRSVQKKRDPKKKDLNNNTTLSEDEKISPPQFARAKIYSIQNFGVLIKPYQELIRPLTFLFHLSKFRCKMLKEERIYILQIIFDKEECELSFAFGYNPKFSFAKSIKKEIHYAQMEESFMEITIYSHPIVNNIEEFKEKPPSEIISESMIYSALKIDLLTLAIAPEHHDIVLIDPKKKHLQIGRINYNISCSHIENISFEIESLKFQLNSLMKNQLALKLKFKNSNGQWETNHSKGIASNPMPKEEITQYEFTPSCEDENILKIESKMSMRELRKTEGVLNIYSTRLIDKKSSGKNEADNIKNYLGSQTKSIINQDNNIELVNSYSLVGYVKLNFYKMLSENDNHIVKQTSKFFMTLSNKNNNESCYKKKKKTTNIENNGSKINEEMKFQVFETITENYNDTIYSHGVMIGTIDMNVKITNVPLIRQIMCGVMTETGFEINSIFLYANARLSMGRDKAGNMSSLPSDLQKLIELKNNLDTEISNRAQLKAYNTEKDFNSQILRYFNGIKECLGKSIEEGCLYYGYSTNTDLYQGQAIMLELGLNILEYIDRITMEQRVCCFEILRLICERSEFHLGTLTLKWFRDKKDNGKSYTEFKEDFLVTNKVVENFIRLNNEAIRLSLEGVGKGQNIDNETKSFLTYFLSVAYFRIPQYRKAFITTVLTDITSDRITKLINSNKNESVEELMEKDPINSLILWDNLFYKKLNSSLEHTTIENEINEQLTEMEEIISYSSTKSKSGWKRVIAKRDLIFFGLVANLAQYILDKTSTYNDFNWLNIPGFDSIFIAIDNKLATVEVCDYPKSLICLIPLFLKNISIINAFINHVIQRTNAYDNKAVFNMLTMIEVLFMKSEIYQNIENSLRSKFDYSTLQLAFKIIITTDNSLSIAKFFWLYYKTAHLMSMNHIGDIISVVLLPNFFTFFFHWSWPVRNSFYFLLLYIFGFRLRGNIPQNDNERSGSNFFRNKRLSLKINEIDLSSGTDIFDKKMGVIRSIHNIIYTEELDPSFNNIIDEKKFASTLEKIPAKVWKNIVISMHHYDCVKQDFLDWKKKNDNNDLLIEYPELEISAPKEDVVEYASDF